MNTKSLTARYHAACATVKASLEGRTVAKTRRAPRARVMFAVISDGRDLGAYRTRDLAQAEADKLADAYVAETVRSSR